MSKDHGVCIQIPGPVASLGEMTLNETVLSSICTLVAVQHGRGTGDFLYNVICSGALHNAGAR